MRKQDMTRGRLGVRRETRSNEIEQETPQEPVETLGPWRKEPLSRRKYRRWQVNLPAVLHVAGEPHNCWIHDLSPGGAQVAAETAGRLAPERDVVLYLGGYGSVDAQVRYSRDRRLGLAFLTEEEARVSLARHLVSLRPARRPARHEARIEATIRSTHAEMTCVVENLSRTGARIQLAEPRHLLLSEEVLLVLPGYGSIAATVRHLDGSRIGLFLTDGFEGPLPD